MYQLVSFRSLVQTLDAALVMTLLANLLYGLV
jgi:hypothetical protein